MNQATSLCQEAHSSLVMVDMQERLLATMAMADREPLLQRSHLLLQAAQRLQIPIVTTEQYPRGLGATQADLAQVLGNHPPLEKTCFSCWGAEGFAGALTAQRPQVIIFGIEAHICVLQTTLELLDAGKQVFVAADAVASRHSEHKHNALARMAQAGAIISNSESIIFEWLADARHEHFRELSALLKEPLLTSG